MYISYLDIFIDTRDPVYIYHTYLNYAVNYKQFNPGFIYLF